MEKKRIQYSKFLPAFSGILFVATILYCMLSRTIEAEIAIAVISATGSVTLTSIVWYLKNSQAEKVAMIKANTYKIASEERLKYNRSMMELKREFDITDEDIEYIEENSPMDEFENNALESLNMSVDESMDEATASIEEQTII